MIEVHSVINKVEGKGRVPVRIGGQIVCWQFRRIVSTRSRILPLPNDHEVQQSYCESFVVASFEKTFCRELPQFITW